MALPFYHVHGFMRELVGSANGLPELAAALGGAAARVFLMARIGGSRTLILSALRRCPGWSRI